MGWMPRGKFHIDRECENRVILFQMESSSHESCTQPSGKDDPFIVRQACLGVEIRMRVLGRVFVILGTALVLYTLGEVMRLKDSKIISWFASGYDSPPGWRLLWRSNQFWFGVLSVATGIELLRLRVWGRLAAIAWCLAVISLGLLTPPKSYFLLLLGGPTLVALAFPLRLTVLNGEYRDVVRRTPHVRYQFRAWCLAIAICVLWALSVLVWSPMINN
jgi:hypothetical protein